MANNNPGQKPWDTFTKTLRIGAFTLHHQLDQAVHWTSYLTSLLFFLTQLSIQLALLGFAEFTLHLTRLGPEMLQIAQDSGRLTVSYSRFEVDDSKGKACVTGTIFF